VRCDVTDGASRDNLVNEALDAFRQIDILVNVAGVADRENKLAIDMDEATWDRVVDTNLKAMFFLTQRVAQHMIERERGSIINLSSFTARIASPRLMPYMAAKAGVLQMTRGMALEWGRYNIRVNAICPGYTLSEMTKDALAQPGGYEAITRSIPYNRKIADPMDIAAAALFLACDASDMVTGVPLFVDGGRSAE
jgi:NAD(P)-dependent dehydrogenase (short-subunit alcohol dehydrogenase family)